VKKAHKLGETNNFRNRTPRGGRGGKKRGGGSKHKDITTITSFDNFDGGAESSSSVNWLRAEVGVFRDGKQAGRGRGGDEDMLAPPRRYSEDSEEPPGTGTEGRANTTFSVESWGGVDTPQNDTPVDPDSLANYSPAKGGLNRPDVEFSLSKEMKREIKALRTAPDACWVVFQCVVLLFQGKTNKNISWYDCRDFVSEVDFNSLWDKVSLSRDRIQSVKRKLTGLGVEWRDVRRINRVAADVLEWIAGVTGIQEEKGGGAEEGESRGRGGGTLALGL
jgi:hypothetical protein